MTLDELRGLGYDFRVTGFQFEVTYAKSWRIGIDPGADTLRGKSIDMIVHDDIMDIWPYALQAVASPRRAGKSAALAANYGTGRKSIYYPEVILKGTIEITNDWRNRRDRRAVGAPRAVDMAAVWQRCREAATIDYVKRKLGE